MSEVKQKAKDLKAARRAEKVAAKAAVQQPGEEVNSSHEGAASNTPANKKAVAAKINTNAKAPLKKGSTVATQEQTSGKITAKPERTVALFSHLEQKKPLSTENVPRDVHPAVLSLALRYSSGQCIGSNNRCIAMLRSFQRVIADYVTPQNLQTSLQRHLPTYLSTQISYLVTARPLSVSMGAAIRLLKQQISTTDIEASDDVNKDRLIEFIDTFIRERIEIAGQVIVKAAQERIKDRDVVLVYAHSTIVEAILLEAAKHKTFSVIVVDSRPKFEGKTILRHLSEAGITCTYIMLTAVSYVMEIVTKVFVGAHTVLSNGAVYSRAGTALISMSASEHHIPVIVACETYKFSDRVQLDSFVANELGLTSELDLPRLAENAVEPAKIAKDDKMRAKSDVVQESTAKQSNVMKLNLMYDVTPDKYITLCVSELGSLPTTAIPFAALSEQNSV